MCNLQVIYSSGNEKRFIPGGDSIFMVNPMSMSVHRFSGYLSQLNNVTLHLRLSLALSTPIIDTATKVNSS